MKTLKNLILGKGRINRRQFIVTNIVVAIIFGLLYFVWIVIMTILYGTSIRDLPYSYIASIIIMLAALPFEFAYTIRRGHDFGLPTYISVIYLIFSIFLSIIQQIQGIQNYLEENSGLLCYLLNVVIAFVYIVYPGNKKQNIYGLPPVDTGKPLRIFKYMTTGSWGK